MLSSPLREITDAALRAQSEADQQGDEYEEEEEEQWQQ